MKIPLEGDELSEYLKAEELKKEEEKIAAEIAKRNAMEEDDSDLSEDEEGAKGAVSKFHSFNQFDVYVKDTVRTGGFFKQHQNFRMFPCVDTRKKVDDYGEIIDPSSFVSAELVFAAASAEHSDEVIIPLSKQSMHLD